MSGGVLRGVWAKGPDLPHGQGPRSTRTEELGASQRLWEGLRRGAEEPGAGAGVWGSLRKSLLSWERPGLSCE